ncbi:Quinate permease [Daldinia childiae]|uniref:Quinate permease n=1 Tax=Daldinia childiae TaxID=326645 RepID=UPI001447C19D|nr:Quinate permease [Daldinia childiae]KAF3065887.1 Quinate permease [Daldinia childiae]
MAGGVKKPVNIFKLKDLGEPKNVFNWRLWFAVISFGLLGAARGVDEGLISGAFGSKDFQRTINYSSYSDIEKTNIKANVSSMVQIGSVGGALFAFVICDRIGRIWATRQLCVLWILGIAIFMGNGGNLGAVYAGRFIAGLGVGQTPVVGPIYVCQNLLSSSIFHLRIVFSNLPMLAIIRRPSRIIAEIAPASIRGLCTCIFTGFVYVGIVLAYFTNYGAQINLGDSTHVRWLAPTSLHIIFAGLIFILTFFQYESPRFLIKQGKHDEATETMAHIRHLAVDDPYVLSEIQAIRTAHEEELEATMGSSWYGVLKEMFLIPSNLYRLYLSAMVQFLSQWSGAGSITLYAPDLFKILGITGQNESLLVTGVFGIVKFVSAVIWITLQAIAMIYVAGFLTAVPELGVDESYVLPAAEASASRGAIAMIYISGCGWALGWNSMQYLLTAELFPLRIRALSTSIVMTLHFANQYGNSRAVPNMLLPTAQGGISPMGTFWSFAAITIVGGLWVWFFVPETGGRSLESMDRLFELPWYKIGRRGNADADLKDEAFNEKAGMGGGGRSSRSGR